jgi:L-threonylcarbamoyladenylate synthase
MPTTTVWTTDPTTPDPAVVAAAAALLRNGKLVAIPTETVYGLAADGLNDAAVRSIFAAKGRPATNPVILHVADVASARTLSAAWPTFAEKLAEKHWPGPLTLVVPKVETIPDSVTAGGPTVAIRCPAHPVARAIIAAVGRPLAAPSANRSTSLSPTRAAHVLQSFDGEIDGIVDAGPCELGIESAVVDCTGNRPVVLRPGSISAAELMSFIGPLGERTASAVARSPGQMAKHYAPNTPIVLVDSPQAAFDKCLADQSRGVRSKSLGRNDGTSLADFLLPETPAEYAAGLYEMLHAIDGRGDVDRLIVELPPKKPEWVAVRDRLHRAAGVVEKTFVPKETPPRGRFRRA